MNSLSNLVNNSKRLKVLFSAFLLSIFFMGCAPVYTIYLHNDSPSPLYLKTHPSIESFYDSAHSSYYDSIIAYKVGKENEYFIYKIAAYQNFRLWSHIGFKPASNDLTFDYIELKSETDTLILDNKEKIVAAAKQSCKKRTYYIEVKK